MFCSNCGEQNPVGNLFCGKCGKKLAPELTTQADDAEECIANEQPFEVAPESSKSPVVIWLAGCLAILLIIVVAYSIHNWYDHIGDNAKEAASIVISQSESLKAESAEEAAIAVETTVFEITTAPIIKPTTEAEAITFAIENIKNGNYEDAWYYSYDFKTQEFSTDISLKEIDTINSYAAALLKNQKTDFESRNSTIELFINPYYKGRLSKEIKEFCLKYADIEYAQYDFQNTKYTINQKKIDALKEVDTREYPRIGMTKSEVYESTWGYPDDRNTTTTAYGTSEQWVYNVGDYDFKFIYLEDGIVTSIQN